MAASTDASRDDAIAAAHRYFDEGGFFADAHSHPWWTTATLNSPLGGLVTWAGQHLRFVANPLLKSLYEQITQGATAALYSTSVNCDPALPTAGILWRNEEFTVADTEIFTVLSQGDSPLAILGFGFLSQRDFVIDFVRNRLLVYIAKAEMDEPS